MSTSFLRLKDLKCQECHLSKNVGIYVEKLIFHGFLNLNVDMRRAVPFKFAGNSSLFVQGLDAPSSEVISLVSHATQDRLKTLVSKLSVIAEHRLDVIKTEGPYEVTDVSISNAR